MPQTAPRRQRRLVLLGFLGVLALALVVRVPGMGMSLWLDEGLSVGIASHPLADIPGLLRQDGSPPLYYLVLHGWMEAFGRSEEAVRALSLLFGLACIPVFFWAARSLFGRRAGWIAAVLAASNPYLGAYSREGRMYTLLVLLCLVAVTAFVHALVFGRRRWVPVLAVALALALYTHNWGLYLGVGLGMAAIVCVVAADDRRRVVLDAATAFGGAGLLYVPWLPTLVAQARRTGAPWSETPGAAQLFGPLKSVVGDDAVMVIVVLAALPALVVAGRRWRGGGTGLGFVALAVSVVGTLVIAWTSSQVEPAWATRYFGVFVPPLLLLMALGLAREGRRGLVALALIVVVWTDLGQWPEVPRKSNMRAAVELVADRMEPGDLVVSTHMEHVPLLRYYLGPDLRYADPSGLVADPTLADWRDGLERVRAATPEQGLTPLVEVLPNGARLLLACPRLDLDEDTLEWFRLMAGHCRSWRRALDGNPTMTLVDGPASPTPRRSPGSSIFLMVYEKHGAGGGAGGPQAPLTSAR
ncbi:MAG: glycosyltransferase family 39 protein [Acidimicrobiales bacterium]